MISATGATGLSGEGIFTQTDGQANPRPERRRVTDFNSVRVGSIAGASVMSSARRGAVFGKRESTNTSAYLQKQPNTSCPGKSGVANRGLDDVRVFPLALLLRFASRDERKHAGSALNRSFRSALRALRSPPGVRQRRRSRDRRAAPALRGARPLRPGHPVAAMGPYGEDLRTRESEARVLPLDGISDRTIADQQHRQSAARACRQRSRRADDPRLAGAARRGARCRPGKRRPRTSGGMLSRFDGDDAVAGRGLRAALRIWNVPPVPRERLAAGAAG